MGSALLPTPLSPCTLAIASTFSLTAVMLCEHREVLLAPGCFGIVMLVASGLACSGVNHCWIVPLRRPLLVCLATCLLPALRRSTDRSLFPAKSRRRVVPSGGRIGFGETFPRAWRFQWAASKPFLTGLPGLVSPHFLPASFLVPASCVLPILRPTRAVHFHPFRLAWSLPMTLRLSLHLRFAKASPEGLCSACFPTLLRASQPSRSG